MKLTNPTWVHHSGGAIYALDINPCFDNVATCGQSDVGGAGLVVIWNTRPIESEKAHADPAVHKVLARIQFQSGVNAVRWSCDGTKFACASDDKEVTIWEFAGRVQSAGTIGSKVAANVEKYKCIHTLHSHNMEVMGVEWSPCGRFLASASMDNTIVVWNAKKFPERIVVLDDDRGGHNAPVKGVSWDPIGKYLSSQAADKSIKLWTTDNWQCERTITKPFTESSQTTMFSRLDWTPDGQYLLAPCAMNNSGPVAQIIQRKGWDLNLDLVGHRKSVTAVRVSNSLFNYTDHKGKQIQVACVAVGSRDKSLSVWVIPNVKRPIVVLRNLFKHSIMDFSWKDLCLMVCSQDGTVKSFTFSEKELGKMLSMQEIADVCEDLYKIRPPQFASINGDTNSIPGTPRKLNSSFVDTPEALLALQKEKENGAASKEMELEKEAEKEIEKKKAALAKVAEERKQQIEIRSKDGKRRIQPVFLTAISEPVETEKGKEQEKESMRTEENGQTTLHAEPTTSSQPSEPIKNTESTAKKVTIECKSTPPEANETNKRRKIASSSHSDATADSSDETMETASSDSESDNDKEAEAEPANTRSNMLTMDFKQPVLRPIEPTRLVTYEGAAMLSAPEQKAQFIEAVVALPADQVDVENEHMIGGARVSKVTYMKAGQNLWTVFIAPVVALVGANRHWVACGSFDRSLRVYSSVTGRLHCSLALDSTPVKMGLNLHKMYALTEKGFIYTWDVNDRRTVMSRQSIAELVNNDASITTVFLCPSGMPLIGFSTGNMYTYSRDFSSWTIVDNGNSALLRLYDHLHPDEFGEGNISRVLKKKKRPGPLPNVPMAIRMSARETQLEEWMNSAREAHSQNDYRRLLNTYVKHLVTNKSEPKLRELLSFLRGTGPIIGLSRVGLRGDVEKIVNTDPTLQHLLKETQGGVLF